MDQDDVDSTESSIFDFGKSSPSQKGDDSDSNLTQISVDKFIIEMTQKPPVEMAATTTKRCKTMVTKKVPFWLSKRTLSQVKPYAAS